MQSLMGLSPISLGCYTLNLSVYWSFGIMSFFLENTFVRSKPKYLKAAKTSSTAAASSKFPITGILSGMNSMIPAVGLKI